MINYSKIFNKEWLFRTAFAMHFKSGIFICGDVVLSIDIAVKTWNRVINDDSLKVD